MRIYNIGSDPVVGSEISWGRWHKSWDWWVGISLWRGRVSVGKSVRVKPQMRGAWLGVGYSRLMVGEFPLIWLPQPCRLLLVVVRQLWLLWLETSHALLWDIHLKWVLKDSLLPPPDQVPIPGCWEKLPGKMKPNQTKWVLMPVCIRIIGDTNDSDVNILSVSGIRQKENPFCSSSSEVWYKPLNDKTLFLIKLNTAYSTFFG